MEIECFHSRIGSKNGRRQCADCGVFFIERPARSKNYPSTSESIGLGFLLGFIACFFLVGYLISSSDIQDHGYRSGYNACLESIKIAPIGSDAPIPTECKADQEWFYSGFPMPYSASMVCRTCEEYEWSKRSSTGGTCVYPPKPSDAPLPSTK